MMVDAPTPHPEPPERISATMLGTYTQCPARAGFERDARFSGLRRSGLRAALGTAAHAVAARNGRGHAAFDRVWDEETARVLTRLRAEWAPSEPPSPDSWPGAALTRARLRRIWSGPLEEAGTTDLADPAPRSGSGPQRRAAPARGALPWVEERLQPVGSVLVGRPDLVERGDRGLRVVDLKTGLRQKEATEPQRRQLLFYCALVLRECGELPMHAAVRDADGTERAIQFEPSDVDEVEANAVEAVTALRDAAAGATLEARPSESTCGVCPFRLVCGPFLAAYDPSWRVGRARVGRVVATAERGDGRSVTDVEVVSPGWARGQTRMIAAPFPAQPTESQVWGFSDFEGQGGSGMARWNTLVARW